MPADFMARFSDPSVRVVAGNTIPPGVSVERESGREVRKLFLRSLEINGDAAKAQFFFVAPSMVVSEKLELTQTNGRWSVTRMMEQERTYF